VQILKTGFWVIIAVALALFAKANWITPPDLTGNGHVVVKLWGDLQLYTRLPAIVFFSFLLGLLPMWLLHQATKWRLHRKIESTERALVATVSPPSPPVSAEPALPAERA
jgi:hypothetical protein